MNKPTGLSPIQRYIRKNNVLDFSYCESIVLTTIATTRKSLCISVESKVLKKVFSQGPLSNLGSF